MTDLGPALIGLAGVGVGAAISAVVGFLAVQSNERQGSARLEHERDLAQAPRVGGGADSSCIQAEHAKSENDAEAAMLATAGAWDQVNERIGELLRSMDDDALPSP